MTKTAIRSSLPLILLAAGLALAGCSKKSDKPAEGTPAAETTKPAEGAKAVEGTTPVAEPAKAEPAKTDPAAATKDLLETAKANGKLGTLVKAIDAAGLTTTLSGAGPFTLLAPSDEAFAKLPPKDLEALLADKTKLEALLQYHVIPSAVLAKDLSTQKAIKTVQGGELAIDAASGVKLGGAAVVTPDITATNGVIHIIDTVLTPPAK